MQKMNILMVSHDYLPNIGGIAAHIYNLSLNLVKLKNRVIVLTSYKERKKSFGFPKKFPAYFPRVNNGIIEFHFPYPGIICRENSKLWSYMERWVIQILVKHYKIDIIHWHTYDADYLALEKIRNIPKIFTNHSSMFIKDFEIDKKKTLKKFYFADAVITPSYEILEKTKMTGFKKESVFYIPNGVDVNMFYPEQNKKMHLRKLLSIGDNQIVAIIARRFVEKNGIHVLVSALKILIKKHEGDLNKIAFLFTGNQVKSDYAEKMMKELNVLKDEGLDIRFLGNVEYKKMPDIYRMADISIVPSLIEATSLTVLESMATGLAVIASDIPGINELIKNYQNGLLFPKSDPEELAEKLAYLITNRERINMLGELARKYVVQNYTWEKIAQKTLNVYHTVTKNVNNLPKDQIKLGV